MDIVPLARRFVRTFQDRHNIPIAQIDDSLLDALVDYPWPGNVRELRNVMERAVIVGRSRWLEPADLPVYIREPDPGEGPVLLVPIGTPAAEAEMNLILRTLEHVGQNKAEVGVGCNVQVLDVTRLEALPNTLPPNHVAVDPFSLDYLTILLKGLEPEFL